MNWKNININKQNVEHQTGRAVLINMPNNSSYSGFKFWHPNKLVRQGRNKGSISIGYHDGFNFKLFKNGNGKYNKKEIIDSIEIDATEFEEELGVMDEGIVKPKTEITKIVKRPEVKNVDKVEHDKGLFKNE